jgi:hypothetical protein
MIVDAFGFFDFFILMGGLVIVIGFASLFVMKDAPDLKPRREEKTYWRQLTRVFNWRTVSENRELFWIFVVMLVYFIGFNVYFSYITIYFVNYLGYSYTIAGALQGGALVLAAFMTIPTAKMIDKGLLARVISIALVANTIGLLCIAFAKGIVPLCIGMFLACCGYILTLQSLTAWMKNLYPEDQRGQFEGIKQVFYVALPMIFGPMIAAPVINNWGVERVVNNVPGMVPGPSLFLVSAAVTALAILPLIAANRLHQRRLLKKPRHRKHYERAFAGSYLFAGEQALLPNGTPVPGYTLHGDAVYTRSRVRAAPWRLKEWDFYQISDDQLCLQLVIGHVSYVGNCNIALFDHATGEKIFEQGVITALPFRSMHLPESAHENSTLTFSRDGAALTFETANETRQLRASFGGLSANVRLTPSLPESVTVCTPFSGKHEFYLNEKINLLRAEWTSCSTASAMRSIPTVRFLCSTGTRRLALFA